MDGKCWISSGFILAFALVGCSQSNAPATSGQQTSAGKTGVVAQGNPDQAVFEFLEAVRTGNDKQAASMLTPLARQKTTEMEMVVAPPGSPTAKFKISGVEYVTPEKDGAHVWSSWTDIVDAEGHTRTDDIIWVLRLEAEGWRIVGMITKVYPDQPPLVLNFEDPEDMMRKQQLLQTGGNPAAEGGANPAEGTPSAQSATRVEPNVPAIR